MPCFLIDTSTTTLFVGAYEGSSWLKLLKKQTGTIEGLFEMAAELFKDYPLESFSKIILCEGPGRLMSLRIAAVACNQWATDKKERWTYNSLQLVAETLSCPTLKGGANNLSSLRDLNTAPLARLAAYELRAGAFAVWNNNKIEIVSELPSSATLIGSAVSQTKENPELYAQAVENFPKLADQLVKKTDFFDPPLYSPIEYIKAGNKAVSKEK